MRIKHKEYFRSTLFGIEDSLISTAALLAGISIGSKNTKFVIMAGIVAITIEAVSMGVGEYLSDDAMDDLDKLKRTRGNPLLSGFLLCVSYIAAGMIPFLPVVFLQYPSSIIVSVICSLIGLFLLGYIKGTLLNTSPWKGAVKIFLVGGVTTILGLLVGLFFGT